MAQFVSDLDALEQSMTASPLWRGRQPGEALLGPVARLLAALPLLPTRTRLALGRVAMRAHLAGLVRHERRLRRLAEGRGGATARSGRPPRPGGMEDPLASGRQRFRAAAPALLGMVEIDPAATGLDGVHVWRARPIDARADPMGLADTIAAQGRCLVLLEACLLSTDPAPGGIRPAPDAAESSDIASEETGGDPDAGAAPPPDGSSPMVSVPPDAAAATRAKDARCDVAAVSGLLAALAMRLPEARLPSAAGLAAMRATALAASDGAADPLAAAHAGLVAALGGTSEDAASLAAPLMAAEIDAVAATAAANPALAPLLAALDTRGVARVLAGEGPLAADALHALAGRVDPVAASRLTRTLALGPSAQGPARFRALAAALDLAPSDLVVAAPDWAPDLRDARGAGCMTLWWARP